jgi:hypothetical protein
MIERSEQCVLQPGWQCSSCLLLHLFKGNLASLLVTVLQVAQENADALNEEFFETVKTVLRSQEVGVCVDVWTSLLVFARGDCFLGESAAC